MVALLNQELGSKNFENFEFLNAGVSSYSPYLYNKKIKSIIKNNKWLKIKSIIILYDKSDVGDNLQYFDRPKDFPITKDLQKS